MAEVEGEVSREQMIAGYSKYWWTFVLRGTVAILFGLAALFWPALTLVVLIYFFGFFVLFEGLLAIFASFGKREQEGWWVLLLEGIAGVLVGLLVLFYPGVTAFVLLIFIAVWAIFTGTFKVVDAVRLRRVIEGEWILGLTGIVSVLFGLFLLISPGAGALAIAWLIGLFAIFFGILLIALGLSFRRMAIPTEAERAAKAP